MTKNAPTKTQPGFKNANFQDKLKPTANHSILPAQQARAKYALQSISQYAAFPPDCHPFNDRLEVRTHLPAEHTVYAYANTTDLHLTAAAEPGPLNPLTEII
jgi:hypothetical protein